MKDLFFMSEISINKVSHHHYSSSLFKTLQVYEIIPEAFCRELEEKGCAICARVSDKEWVGSQRSGGGGWVVSSAFNHGLRETKERTVQGSVLNSLDERGGENFLEHLIVVHVGGLCGVAGGLGLWGIRPCGIGILYHYAVITPCLSGLA